MIAYIQTDSKDNYFNVNAFVANEGFNLMGWETMKFHKINEILDLNPEIVVVGGIGNVRKRLEILGFDKIKTEIDYPDELIPFLGRKIWTCTFKELMNKPESWNVFVKPQQETKLFVVKVVKEIKDFIGIVDHQTDFLVWCSEIVDFVTEWRCFVRYGELIDVRRYKGNWDTKIDINIVKNAIKAFHSQPAAYVLDFGIDKNGNLKLVEVNDGYSVGSYGMNPILYAKFISARWSQLTKTTDYANF